MLVHHDAALLRIGLVACEGVRVVFFVGVPREGKMVLLLSHEEDVLIVIVVGV